MFNNFRYRFSQFMQGRYGMDQLGRMLSRLCIVFVILNIIFRKQILWYLALACIVVLDLRMFSKNIQKRYAENQKYLVYETKVRSWFSNLKYNITHFQENREKNKGYHIYKCPRCKQKIRIPKGKGNIMVRCPKCQFEFHKRS